MSIELIVEDGSIIPNANSFSSIAIADSFLIGFGNEEWLEEGEEKKKSCLIQGCTYLNHFYRWKGITVSRNQATAWPRYSVYDQHGILVSSNSIPIEVIQANIILADEARKGPIFTNSPGGQAIKKEKVDVIEVEYSTSRHYQPTFPLVDNMLKDYIRGGGGSRIIEMVLG